MTHKTRIWTPKSLVRFESLQYNFFNFLITGTHTKGACKKITHRNGHARNTTYTEYVLTKNTSFVKPHLSKTSPRMYCSWFCLWDLPYNSTAAAVIICGMNNLSLFCFGFKTVLRISWKMGPCSLRILLSVSNQTEVTSHYLKHALEIVLFQCVSVTQLLPNLVLFQLNAAFLFCKDCLLENVSKLLLAKNYSKELSVLILSCLLE